MYLALEYAENGELFDYIAETGVFSEKIARFYFHQLISAIEYLHTRGYYHRDVKPENILLDSSFNLKLADFGFTTAHEISYSRKGTYGYMAPEVLAKQEYRGEQADLFASAVILFILLSQHPPFLRAEEGDRYYKKIIQERWDRFWEIYNDENFSESFKDMFSKMVSPNPDERLTLEEVKAHEWFNGPTMTHDEILEEFFLRQSKLIKNRELKSKKQKKEKFDDDDEETDATPSGNKHKKKKNKPMYKKYTKFFEVSDGDDLINAIVDVANKKGYGIDKSPDYFRVTLDAKNDKYEVSMTINVLKSPEEEKRCLEFLLNQGDKALFREIYGTCKKYCRVLFESK
jgi:serine/threonine protein kinase